jgi:hypothetical protein
MAPTTYMLLVLPTEGASIDQWGTLLNVAIGGVNGIDAHDHTTGRGTRVPSAGININAALVFNGQRGTQIAGLALTDLGALLGGGAREIFVKGGDLYYRNGSGANVRLTNGATLDVTSVGGIAGDYAAVSAEVAYVDATDTYTLKQQLQTLVRQYARIACADIDVYEYKAAGVTPVPPNRVRIQSPAALAASYALTLPAAPPAATSIVQVSSAGVLTASNAALDALTLAANKSITISGTGEIKHGTRTIRIHGSAFQGSTARATPNQTGASLPNGQDNLCPLPLIVGDRIQALRFFVRDAATNLGSALLYSADSVGTSAVVGSAANSSGSGANQTLAPSFSSVTLVTSGVSYVANLVTSGGGGGSFFVRYLEVDYDHP